MADDFGMGYALGADSGNNNNGGGFGGNFGEGLWAVIILAILFGRGGFGGFGGGNGGAPCATQSDLAAGFGNSAILGSLNDLTLGQAGIQQTLCQGFNGVNTTVLQGFNGVDNAVCTLGYNMQSGINTLAHQMSDCCCTTQRAIDGVNYNMQTGINAINTAICSQTRDIIEAQNANYRSLMDFMVQDKIATLQAENQGLKFAASQANQNAFIIANQEAQTAELIRRLGRDNPVPAYVVPNPNCCYTNYNSGCGCGC